MNASLSSSCLGRVELATSLVDRLVDRVRLPGGGRPPRKKDLTILTTVQELVEPETAGDPMTGQELAAGGHPVARQQLDDCSRVWAIRCASTRRSSRPRRITPTGISSSTALPFSEPCSPPYDLGWDLGYALPAETIRARSMITCHVRRMCRPSAECGACVDLALE